jgi:hypothetical protein
MFWFEEDQLQERKLRFNDEETQSSNHRFKSWGLRINSSREVHKCYRITVAGNSDGERKKKGSATNLI